jgi:vesicle-fusing ATPase
LHVIIIDELDAIFRRRSISQDSGEITRNSLVNQLLAKIDGVIEMPNTLVIGITNRKELIDEALLRPGRLEIQMHIPLPDAEGRREILKIHFHALWKCRRLSQPLQLSINGQTGTISSGLRRYFNLPVFQKLKKYISDPSAIWEYQSLPDLAADEATGGFSGADIAGLVRCAGSIALARSRREGSGVDGVLITLNDVMLALEEIKGQKKKLT